MQICSNNFSHGQRKGRLCVRMAGKNSKVMLQ